MIGVNLMVDYGRLQLIQILDGEIGANQSNLENVKHGILLDLD